MLYGHLLVLAIRHMYYQTKKLADYPQKEDGVYI